MEIISNLLKNIQIRIKTTHTHFNQIHLLVIFCPIYFIIVILSLFSNKIKSCIFSPICLFIYLSLYYGFGLTGFHLAVAYDLLPSLLFLALLYFLVLPVPPSSYYVFLAPVLELAIFTRCSDSFYWKTLKTKIWALGCVHCYWSANLTLKTFIVVKHT